MQPKTKQPKQEPLSHEEIMEALNLADVDRLSIESEIEAQRVMNKNEVDKILIDKIEMLLVVLEHPNVDEVDKMPIRKKLVELVDRM